MKGDWRVGADDWLLIGRQLERIDQQMDTIRATKACDESTARYALATIRKSATVIVNTCKMLEYTATKEDTS
jgi:hypothetical protein